MLLKYTKMVNNEEYTNYLNTTHIIITAKFLLCNFFSGQNGLSFYQILYGGIVKII